MSADEVEDTTAHARGLSRRQMIRASAVAGAAAWTAPVIVDSLTSPAAAGSNCHVYWVKLLGTSTSVSYNCPGSISFDVCDAWWAQGNPVNPPSNFVSGGGCPTNAPAYCGQKADADHGAHLPTGNVGDSFHSIFGVNRAYYRKITLGANCTFSSSTTWQIGGRYNDSYLEVGVADTCTSAPAWNSGSAGCYDADTNTAWISAYLTPGDRGSTGIDYVYLKFCCSTKP